MKPSQHAFERVLAVILACVVSAVTGYAQATSRVIPFSGVQTTLPASTTQAVTVQMFDEGGILITAEDHPAVPVDEAGRISFLFGSMTGGLNPDHFPSGSSRLLDVIDPATGASVLTSGRIALNATAFALSPGPQGPQGERGLQGEPGPQGERGEQGPPGSVTLPFSGTVSSSSPALDVSNTGSGHGLVVAISGERAVFGQSTGLNGSGAVGVATNGSNARGVWGFSPTGFGVIGDGGPFGVYGVASSSGDFSQGVRGVAGAASGLTFGVWGESLSTSAGAVGVLGRSGTAGNTSGVWGETNSPAGVGGTFFNAAGGDIIRGLNSARQQVFRVTNNGTTVSQSSTGSGVAGQTNGGSSVAGVKGVSSGTNGIGVWGEAFSGPLAVGVYGNNPGGLAGVFNGRVLFQGILEIPALGAAGSQPLCRNFSGRTELASCSSSLRYKTNVRPFVGGLDIVNRLRPIAFTWTQGGMRDIGLGAEDVEQVEPLLTFRNEEGEIEGVKYNQLSAVFVNAFAEQQAQLQRQQDQINALKKLVCSSHSSADICK